MAVNVNLLKTRAQCVEAKKRLERRLARLANKDSNLEFREEEAEFREESAAARLTRATNDRAAAQAQLARTDLSSAERRRQESLEIKARHLIEAAAEGDSDGAGGVADFFENVGAAEIDLLTPFLTTTIADVQLRHDALPA
jgi:hypothetical protein